MKRRAVDHRDRGRGDFPLDVRGSLQRDAILGRQRALNFPPGSFYSYSNSGYNLAAIIVSRVSGMSFADFTRTRVNGMEAQATTGGTDSSGGANRGRGFDFNVFASELFNSITVRKSQQADLDDGSLGATVDLGSARPFDYRGLK